MLLRCEIVFTVTSRSRELAIGDPLLDWDENTCILRVLWEGEGQPIQDPEKRSEK